MKIKRHENKYLLFDFDNIWKKKKNVEIWDFRSYNTKFHETIGLVCFLSVIMVSLSRRKIMLQWY